MNYATRFHTIENAFDDDTENEMAQEIEETADETPTEPNAFAVLEQGIAQWVAEKGFTKQGITLDQLTALLFTNRSYLSEYINTQINKSFREWINELRIAEAQKLMLKNPANDNRRYYGS